MTCSDCIAYVLVVNNQLHIWPIYIYIVFLEIPGNVSSRQCFIQTPFWDKVPPKFQISPRKNQVVLAVKKIFWLASLAVLSCTTLSKSCCRPWLWWLVEYDDYSYQPIKFSQSAYSGYVPESAQVIVNWFNLIGRHIIVPREFAVMGIAAAIGYMEYMYSPFSPGSTDLDSSTIGGHLPGFGSFFPCACSETENFYFRSLQSFSLSATLISFNLNGKIKIWQ